MKNGRAIFKACQMKAIPEYIVLALPRSIIGVKEQTLPTRIAKLGGNYRLRQLRELYH